MRTQETAKRIDAALRRRAAQHFAGVDKYRRACYYFLAHCGAVVHPGDSVLAKLDDTAAEPLGDRWDEHRAELDALTVVTEKYAALGRITADALVEELQRVPPVLLAEGRSREELAAAVRGHTARSFANIGEYVSEGGSVEAL